MTTLRNFALCVFCALAFGCGGGETDTAADGPEPAPPAAEAPEPETPTQAPAPPSEAEKVRANLMRSCVGEDSDFCAAAHAAIARWVAGELTDEEFVQEIVSLRAEPETPFRILSIVANCDQLMVTFSELANLWGFLSFQGVEATAWWQHYLQAWFKGGRFLAVDRDPGRAGTYVQEESHYIRFTSWEEDFFQVQEGEDSNILILGMSEPVLAGQKVELDMAFFVLPPLRRHMCSGPTRCWRGPIEFPSYTLHSSRVYDRTLADAEGVSPHDRTRPGVRDPETPYKLAENRSPEGGCEGEEE